MEKEEFLKLDIKAKIQFINDKTITGLKVSEVAEELSMGDNSLRRILKKNNYIYNRVDKVYAIGEISDAVPKEEKNNNEIETKEKPNNVLFSNEQVESLKELLAVKEELLHMAITIKNKNPMYGTNIENIEKINRKKVTFNIEIELLNELKKYEKKLINISKSDIVNKAIMEYLERNN